MLTDKLNFFYLLSNEPWSDWFMIYAKKLIIFPFKVILAEQVASFSIFL